MRKINIKKYLDVLLTLDLFNGFTKDELRDIFNTSDYGIEKYGKGQIIHLQHEVCASMDIILEGKVSVQKIEEGGNILKITVLSAGDSMGANLIFASRNTYPMTVVAEGEAVVLHIYRDLVLRLSQGNDDFLIKLMRVISDKALVLTDKIDAISLKTIRERIRDFLRYEYYIQNNNVIKLNMSKKDLAERLGIPRSSLGRELNKMRGDGLLDYDVRTISLKDIEYFL